MTIVPNGSQPNENAHFAKLKKRVAEFCTAAGYQLSPQADHIIQDIVNMKQSAGDFYCTCQVGRSPETVCVCQAVRNGLVEVMGACYCALILSANEMKE